MQLDRAGAARLHEGVRRLQVALPTRRPPPPARTPVSPTPPHPAGVRPFPRRTVPPSVAGRASEGERGGGPTCPLAPHPVHLPVGGRAKSGRGRTGPMAHAETARLVCFRRITASCPAPAPRRPGRIHERAPPRSGARTLRQGFGRTRSRDLQDTLGQRNRLQLLTPTPLRQQPSGIGAWERSHIAREILVRTALPVSSPCTIWHLQSPARMARSQNASPTLEQGVVECVSPAPSPRLSQSRAGGHHGPDGHRPVADRMQ